jgi:hypothetical protein
MEADAAALEQEREQWKMARFGAIRSRIGTIMVRVCALSLYVMLCS